MSINKEILAAIEREDFSQEITELFGSIAHELLSPSATILMVIERVEEKLKEDDYQGEEVLSAIKKMKESAKDLLEITKMLLDSMRNNRFDPARFHVLSIEESIQGALRLYPFQPGEKEKVTVGREPRL